jgi:hypothetical protein
MVAPVAASQTGYLDWSELTRKTMLWLHCDWAPNTRSTNPQTHPETGGLDSLETRELTLLCLNFFSFGDCPSRIIFCVETPSKPADADLDLPVGFGLLWLFFESILNLVCKLVTKIASIFGLIQLQVSPLISPQNGSKGWERQMKDQCDLFTIHVFRRVQFP